MQTTSPTPPATNVNPQERARELVLQSLLGIEILLDGGKRKAAATALRCLLDRAGHDVAADIAERAAVQELTRDEGWVQPRPANVRYVPPSRVRVRRGPVRPADPRRQAGDAAAAAYLAGQDPAPIETSGWDEPVWGNLDYDLAALTDLRGAPCLGCKLERTRADLGNPDGLCVDCRDSGLTRELAIHRYCAVVADRNAAPQTTDLLRKAWTRATRAADKAVIAAWVTEHQDRVAS